MYETYSPPFAASRYNHREAASGVSLVSYYVVNTRRIDIDQNRISDAVSTEWLLTNDLGGFSMGTAAGVNTRRYHGLLIAAVAPPVCRVLALHSFVEFLHIDGRTIDLATHQFGNDASLHPDGWRRLVQFEFDIGDAATWTFRIDDLTITKRLSVIPGHNAVRIEYRFTGLNQPIVFGVRALTPMRDFHELQQRGQATLLNKVACPLCWELEHHDTLLVRNDNLVLRLTGTSGGGGWRIDPDWWRDFAYVEDRDRGQSWQEDVWSPGVFEAQLRLGAVDTVTIEVELIEPQHIAPQRTSIITRSTSEQDVLSNAAQQFIVSSRARDQWFTSIIAGYPWFADWGRDAMISLEGLLLIDSRFEEAISVLTTFARKMRNGLIPNRFDDDAGEAHYNTVDASLWFVHAVHALWKRCTTPPLTQEGDRGEGLAFSIGKNDRSRLDIINQELLPTCRKIIHSYKKGTAYDIKMDSVDGLIAAGNANTQLTWMDAQRDGVVFTPRHGKAIEINALWYNALHCYCEMSDAPSEQDELKALAIRVGQSIQSKFWWRDRDCLHDVLVPDGKGGFAPDEKLRPNQIFAASLPYSPLTKNQQRSVVHTVRDQLLTPYGLRTLDYEDPEYRGRYEGDMAQRDAAYHNGTVWPWLIGPYCEALLRVNDSTKAAKDEVKKVIQPMINALDSGCLGQIAEIYDGDPPHRSSGCPAQAWSIAEIRRIVRLTEDSCGI